MRRIIGSLLVIVVLFGLLTLVGAASHPNLDITINGTTGLVTVSILGSTFTITLPNPLKLIGDLWITGPTPWVDIRSYGAVAGGSASTNTTAIQAAVTAASALTGGRVYIPPEGCYDIDDEIAVTNGIEVFGDGSGRVESEEGGSCVRLTEATQNGFNVNSISGPLFRNFQIRHASTHDSGSAIAVNGDDSLGIFGSQKVRIYNMTFREISIPVNLGSFIFAVIDQSTFWNCLVTCVGIGHTTHHDQGDTVITNSTFAGPDNAYGVLWNSGGGLRFIANKCLGLYACVALDPAWSDSEAPVDLTGDFMIGYSSMEGYKRAAVLILRNSGTKALLNVHITDNQMATSSSVCENPCYGIDVPTSNAAFVTDLILANNLFNGFDAAGNYKCINLQGGTRYRIHDNICNSSTVAITVGGSATDVRIGANTFTNVTTLYSANAETMFEWGAPVAFASLPASAKNGSVMPCLDCAAANPCTGSADGRIAHRRAGVWACDPS